jgi:hypothetical protein
VRLWTLHPQYLDARGLVALWREALLARAVLRGETRGYRHHPQVERFRAQPSPRAAIDAYLRSVLEESVARGYAFDAEKAGSTRSAAPIIVTAGQVEHEWRHLLAKLAARSPEWGLKWRDVGSPRCHPLFEVRPGPVEPWERSA